MKYIIDIAENKSAFAEEFFKSISFIKNVKAIRPNEITNPAVLESIEQYEKGKVEPCPLSLAELKQMLNA
ncbi:MAG: hypothetical protein WCH34_12860 [Bacteroidota bacterium]